MRPRPDRPVRHTAVLLAALACLSLPPPGANAPHARVDPVALARATTERHWVP